MSDKVTKTIFEKAVRRKAELTYHKNETELYNYIDGWIKRNGYSGILQASRIFCLNDDCREATIQLEESNIQLDVFNKLDELKFLLQEQDDER